MKKNHEISFTKFEVFKKKIQLCIIKTSRIDGENNTHVRLSLTFSKILKMALRSRLHMLVVCCPYTAVLKRLKNGNASALRGNH